MGWKISIRLNIFSHFVALILISAALLLSLQHYFNIQAAIRASEESFSALFEKIKLSNQAVADQAQALLKILAKHPDLQKDSLDTQALVALFSHSLEAFPRTYAVYLATADNHFVEVVNMQQSPTLQAKLHAPDATRWTVIEVLPKLSQNNYRFRYYDADFKLLAERVETTNYQASQRPWFTNALSSEAIVQSKPYQFWHLNAPGITFSQRLENQAVLAVDYTVEHLAELFESQKPNPASQTVLFDRLGERLYETGFHPSPSLSLQTPLKLSAEEKTYLQSLPLLKVSNQQNWAPFDYVENGQANGFSVALLKVLADKIGLNIQFVNDYTWQGLSEQFAAGRIDIMHSLLYSENRAQQGLFSLPYYQVSNFWITRKQQAPIETASQLKNLTFALGRQWQSTQMLLAAYPDLQYKLYDDLPAMMRAVNQGEVDVLIDNAHTFLRAQQKYQFSDLTLNRPVQPLLPAENGLHFYLQPKYAPLLPILNRALESIPAEAMADFAAQWHLQGAETQGSLAPFEQLFFLLFNDLPEADATPRLYKTRLQGQDYLSVVSPILYNHQPAYLASFVAVEFLLIPYRSQWFAFISAIIATLMVLLWVASLASQRIVRPLHQLMARNQLIAERRFEQITPVRTHINELQQLSETLQKVAKSFQEYECEQEQFLHGLSRLLAEAIDKRSHHTYSHCSRVPKLGMMLMRAALADTQPPFADFSLSEEELRAFELGAWLHDSGKITTPESVLDKSTKLDCFYNRIHEIRMRFEVLWRDAELAFCHANMQQPMDAEEKRVRWHELQQQQQQLQADFAWLAELNLGEIPINEVTLARLDALSQRSWQAHFDRRFGVSRFEGKNMATSSTPWQTLLQDLPEHLIPRTDNNVEIYREQGFLLKVPKYARNFGEKHNLSVASGTLTEEERFIMQDHVVMTLRLLEQVPMPQQYRNVPKYAGTHHERLDGSGYPRQLQAQDLGIPERIMAIADIFEALTAPDRPYKQTYALSDALDCLYEMVKQGQLDGEVFALFLRSGVYQAYAEQFLDPSKRDAVDLNRYVNPSI
ncbi:MAG: transporter substrate-binding domain-containing protein [Thiotrichales bacterium]|nr:transporter substrate-binding domain-containing protein [Thiotrichales bacterium]